MKESKFNISFENIVALLPAHVYWLDRDNIYLGCNNLQAIAAGLKNRLEIIGKTNYDMPWRDQADTLNIINNEVMRTGQECSIEETTRHANGRELIFLSKKIPLFDKQGNVVGILGISFDITDQKETEKKLVEAKEETDIALENIIAYLPGNVYWLDRNNVFIGCNNSQAIAAGLKNRSEIVGKTNYDMPWRDRAEALNTINNKVMSTGEEYSIEEIGRNADGTELTFLSKKVPLLDNKGNITGILGISFDIAKQKEAEKKLMEAKEKAETANNAKTEFLENMRHDIRTPLSGIIGFSEILRREEDKNKIKEHALILAESSKELLRFLNEVLESINVASGRIPLLKQKFDLRETLANIIKLHQPKALEKNLHLTLVLDESIPKYLLGDPGRIYRIVLELLVNALKFTQEGHVTISTKIGKKKERDVILQIFVEDTGSGIPAEKQQDLFVRFKRLTPSYQGIYQGSGLGLSIVKQFINDLEGEIYVDSHLNVGTKFVCIIPLTLPLLDEPFEGGKISTAPEKSTFFKPNSDENPKRNIKKYGLIVEDQPIAALAVKTLLEQQGCIMETAETGEMAVKLAKENRYDFIIMDIGLPDIGGYEVTKAIRAFEASQPQPFIAGLTGHIEIEKKQHALYAGMNVFLTKPLTEEMAIDLLKNV